MAIERAESVFHCGMYDSLLFYSVIGKMFWHDKIKIAKFLHVLSWMSNMIIDYELTTCLNLKYIWLEILRWINSYDSGLGVAKGEHNILIFQLQCTFELKNKTNTTHWFREDGYH